MNVERLRLALIASGQAESYAFSKRWAERIAAEYDRLTREALPSWGPCIECGATEPFGPNGHKPTCTVAYPYGSPPDLYLHGGAPDPGLKTAIPGIAGDANREPNREAGR